MKKLICSKDVEEAKQNNLSTIYIEDKTIITPAARDMAENLEISFVKQEKKEENNVDNNKLFKLFSLLSEKGMIEEFLKYLRKPYDEKVSKTGLRIIDGNSIKLENLIVNEKKTNVNQLELFSFKKSDVSVGIIEILKGEHTYQTKEIEIYYIASGELEIMIGNERFIAHQNDIVFIPKDQNIRCNAINTAKMLYIKSNNL